MTTPNTLTGAELQTLREAAGLTREVLAGLANVQARTVKHWETRTGAAVPADVAAIVQAAAGWVLKAAREGLRAAMLQAHGGPMAASMAEAMAKALGPKDDGPEAVLIRYRETDHLHTQDQAQGLRADVHGAMVSRLALDLMANGLRPRVVWFDPEDFNAWRDQLRQQAWGARVELLKAYSEHTGKDADPYPDTPQWRAAWAAQAIERQAIPHPGDQPPASHTPGA